MRPKGRNRLVTVSAGIIVIGLVFFGFLRGLERYDETVPTPPSRDARNDRYLALKRWLTDQDVAHVWAKRFSDPAQLDRYGTVIMDSASLIGMGGFGEAVSWLISGGRLLLVIDPDELESPSRALSMVREEMEAYGYSFTQSSTPEAVYPTEVAVDGPYGNTYGVHADTRIQILTENTISAIEGAAPHIDVSQFGAGVLIISGRPWFLENDYIGLADNGEWAWDIIAPVSEGSTVVFALSGRTSATGERGADLMAAIAGIALAVILLALKLAHRPGTLLYLTLDAGADISVRLSAEGVFLWKYQRAGSVIPVCRKDVMRTISRKGLVSHESNPDWGRISRISGLNAAEIREVMSPEFNPVWASQVKEAVAIYKHLKDTL